MTQKEASQQYVAFLRGINVGGKNKLPMKELMALFMAAGCDRVQNYIQSGNILFHAAPGLAARLPQEIHAEIARYFGISSPVVVRTAEEMDAIINNNPFLKKGTPEETLYVMFLGSLPGKEAIRQLDPERSPGDAFLVRGREIYLHLPHGGARSKLTNDYFDRKLATISTARNWRTLKAISSKFRAA